MTEINIRNDIKVELVQHVGSDEMVAKAARVSTGNDLVENDKIKGLIGYLVKAGHTVPLEHSLATFRIEAPIFVAREAMRHRTFSFSEISGRYAKLKPDFYVPKIERPLVNEGSGAHPKLEHAGTIAERESARELVFNHSWDSYDVSWDRYESQLSAGVATEVARNVLPVATYTAWYQTGNLHAWLNFLNLRIHNENATYPSYPQWEIEQMALQIKAELVKLFPITMAAWEERQSNPA